MPLHIDIVTIFPEMLEGFLGQSMMKRAVELGAVTFNPVQLRDYTTDKHNTTDDRPFGGGPGMVMKPEPLFAAVEDLRRDASTVIYLSPAGVPFSQRHAESLAAEQTHLIFICGHYEGIDQRVIDELVDLELSIGDYVLTNGVLPAAVISDAVVRLIPGVLGGEGAAESESFSLDTDGMLEGPQYTRPAEFRGMEIPKILLSGDHKKIAEWRHQRGLELTRERRPDLLDESEQTKD